MLSCIWKNLPAAGFISFVRNEQKESAYKKKIVQSIKKLVDIGPDKGYNDCNNIKDNIKKNIIGGLIK